MQSNNIPKSIFILGSDRSGTSMIAGTLSEMGFQTSQDLIVSPDVLNSKGYFESKKLIQFNQSLLKNYQLNELEFNFELLKKFKDEIMRENNDSINDFIKTNIINTINNSKNFLFFWKDPRLFKTFILLENFFNDLKKIDYIGFLNIRKPELVSSSIYKRNSIDQNYLITYYLLGINFNLKNLKKAIVFKSENFLNNPIKIIRMLKKIMDIEIPNQNLKKLNFPEKKILSSKSAITHFIDPVLYNFSNMIYEKIEDGHINSNKNIEICDDIEKFFFDNKNFIYNSKDYSKTLYLHSKVRQLELSLNRTNKKIIEIEKNFINNRRSWFHRFFFSKKA